MADLLPIESLPEEVFGLAAVVHYLRPQDAGAVQSALNECGLTITREMAEAALSDWQLMLHSDIDGSFPESVDSFFEAFEAMDEPTRRALERAIQIRPAGRVLDIGCGAGRYLKVFAEKKYDAVGIDVSRLLVWLCQNRVRAEVQKRAVEDLNDAIGVFDVQLLLGHNLGIGATVDGVRKLFEICTQRAAPNGVLILNSIDVEKCGEDFAISRLAHNLQSKAAHPGETEYWLEFGPLQTGRFPWIHVSFEEVIEWTKPMGWEPVEVWLDSEEPGHWCAVLRRQ